MIFLLAVILTIVVWLSFQWKYPLHANRKREKKLIVIGFVFFALLYRIDANDSNVHFAFYVFEMRARVCNRVYQSGKQKNRQTYSKSSDLKEPNLNPKTKINLIRNFGTS